MEQQAKDLREKRSQLKRDLTLHATKIGNAIKRNAEYAEITELAKLLDTVFEHFTTVHLEFVDLVEGDESLDNYKTVNNLSLDQYYDKAKHNYETSIASVVQNEKQFLFLDVKQIEHRVNRGIEDVNVLIAEISDLESLSSQSTIAIDEVTRFICELEFASNKIGYDCSSLRNNVESCIVKLRQKVLNTKGTKAKPDTHQSDSVIQPDQMNVVSQQSSAESPSNHVSEQLPVSMPSSQISHSNQNLSVNPQSSPQPSVDDVEERVSVHQRLLPRVSGEQIVQTTDNSKQVSKDDQLNTSFRSSSSLSITQAYNSGGTSANSQVGPPSFIVHRRPAMDSHFKKASAPVFSGERKAWPEFKTIFPSYCNANFHSEEDRAWGLKSCLMDKALQHVRAIFINQPNAFNRMWSRLISIYEDPSLTVQQAQEELKALKQVQEGDLNSLITFVNDVEQCYSQLGEVHQLSAITMNVIDDLSDLLPYIIQRDWMKTIPSLTGYDQLHPFTPFMVFLEGERSIAFRRSEKDLKRGKSSSESKDRSKGLRVQTFSSMATSESPQSSCLVHQAQEVRHSTRDCNGFKRMNLKERKELIARNNACFLCFEHHRRSDCPNDTSCQSCGKRNHHTLLCDGRANDTSFKSQPQLPDKNQEAPSAVSPSLSDTPPDAFHSDEQTAQGSVQQHPE